MNKIYYQQVAKCTDDGKLEINDKETLEAYVNDLFNAPPAISKMEEMLRLGTACLKEGNESVALDIFRAAYHLLYPLEAGRNRNLNTHTPSTVHCAHLTAAAMNIFGKAQVNMSLPAGIS